MKRSKTILYNCTCTCIFYSKEVYEAFGKIIIVRDINRRNLKKKHSVYRSYVWIKNNNFDFSWVALLWVQKHPVLKFRSKSIEEKSFQSDEEHDWCRHVCTACMIICQTSPSSLRYCFLTVTRLIRSCNWGIST